MTSSGTLGAGQGPASVGTPWIGLGICWKIQIFLQHSPSPHPLLRASLPPAPSLLPWDLSAAHVQQQRGSCPAHWGASRLLLVVLGGGICFYWGCHCFTMLCCFCCAMRCISCMYTRVPSLGPPSQPPSLPPL